MQTLEEQLIQKYENLLLKAQKYKIPEKEMTIFDTALKNHHENPITELLAFFIDPNEKHGLDTGFYNGFTASLNKIEEYANFDFGEFIALSTQQTTENGNRIDLWVETDTALIIVEVKVHHHQNNPFKDYAAWGKKTLKQLNTLNKNEGQQVTKQLVTIVLCPTGESYTSDWHGVAYNNLTSEIETALAHTIFKNPLNKWGIFARDFLLHLESFVDLLETNMESLKFVVDNMQQIQSLVELRESVYREIIDHINNELQTTLGEDYEPNVRWHTWHGNPAFRFSGNNWTDKWTDTVLNLHIDRKPMSCSIHIHIENQTDEITKKVKQFLIKGKYSREEPWYEKNKKFWCMSWELTEFDLNEVTKQIVFLHTILNRVEIEWK